MAEQSKNIKEMMHDDLPVIRHAFPPPHPALQEHAQTKGGAERTCPSQTFVL